MKSLINFIKKFLRNNGHLRGALYFFSAVLAGLVKTLTHWATTPPPNCYDVAAEFLGAFAAGLVAVRAFIDTHLARNKNDTNQNTDIIKS
jgi:hypothetical protein